MPLIPGDKPLDVICQFTRYGEIIPIKFRMEDDEGILQEYKVIGYRQVLEDWKRKNTAVLSYECKIIDHNQIKVVKYSILNRKTCGFTGLLQTHICKNSHILGWFNASLLLDISISKSPAGESCITLMLLTPDSSGLHYFPVLFLYMHEAFHNS